jgi:hypothetical protein
MPLQFRTVGVFIAGGVALAATMVVLVIRRRDTVRALSARPGRPSVWSPSGRPTPSPTCASSAASIIGSSPWMKNRKRR